MLYLQLQWGKCQDVCADEHLKGCGLERQSIRMSGQQGDHDVLVVPVTEDHALGGCTHVDDALRFLTEHEVHGGDIVVGAGVSDVGTDLARAVNLKVWAAYDEVADLKGSLQVNHAGKVDVVRRGADGCTKANVHLPIADLRCEQAHFDGP